MGSESLGIDEPPRPSAEVRFETLYERHYRHVWSYCRRRVSRERVDDVVAETFLTAWKRIDDVPDGDGALLWLYRVAYRAVGHQWRGTARRKRLGVKLAAVPDPIEDTPEDTAINDDETQRVLVAAARLNASDAEILRLQCWERLTRQEIAGVLGLDPNAVSQRLHRAKQNLTKEYQRLERRRNDRTPAARKGGTP